MNLLQLSGNLFGSLKLALTVLVILISFWLAGNSLNLKKSLKNRYSVFIAFIKLFTITFIILSLFTTIYLAFPGSSGHIPNKWLLNLFHFSFCMITGWHLAKVVHTFISQKYIDQHDHHQTVPGLLRNVVYGGTLIISTAIYFKIQEYSLTGIWISTGLLTALIGFALQQPLRDLFSGLALGLEGSFRLGDWLRLEDDIEGRVIDINWRATRFRCWDNTTLVIPNAKLASQGFKNLHGDMHLYSPWYYVKIPAEVDPRFAKELLLESVLNCKHVLKDPAPVVRLTNASTLPYTYMIWVFFPNYPSMFRGREDLYREIHYTLQKAGVTPAAEIHEWRTRRTEIPSAEPPTVQIALRSLDIFSSLNDLEIEDLSLNCRQLRYDAGSTILLEGDSRDSLDIVTSGIIESQIEISKGELLKVGEFSAGQYFGLISMFTDQPSIFSYASKTDATLIRIDLESIQNILKDHPDLTDRYALIIKQRLDEADFLRRPYIEKASTPATLQQIKHLVRKILTTERF